MGCVKNRDEKSEQKNDKFLLTISLRLLWKMLKT